MILEFFTSLVQTYGYLGVFLVSLIGSSTIIFILPTDIIVFAAGAILDPLLVGILAGLGEAIGEIVGYVLGLGGRKIINKKYKKDIKKWEKKFKKYGGFFIIVLFAATPLPDDIVGIIGGTLRYPFKKFLLASFIGKTIMALVLAYGGFYGINWILQFF
ncbi:MAG: hypothetical protein GTN40_00625 [Candidatus Aenigmarchaeota archaeon]|nr:hypothetical protein [Candidatus Aenigmarchaeota archaeon]